METFKLKSIDEFDELFVAERKKKEVPAPKKESLIPDMEQTSPEEIDLFGDFGEAEQEAPAPSQAPPAAAPETFAPVKPEPAAPLHAAPPQPLYESPKMSDQPLEPLYEDPAAKAARTYAEAIAEDEGREKKKSSAGAIIGKAVCIAVLVIDVIVFVLGCFVSLFLDTQRSLGKYTLNTQAVNITDENVSGGKIKKGDLIIAEKIAAAEYKKNDFVAVPSSEPGGCEIAVVESTQPVGTDSAELSLINTSNLNSVPVKYSSDKIYGKVAYFIPMIAGIVGLALQNTVLCIIAFILLAAVACALLVVIDIAGSKERLEAEEDEDDETLTPSDSE